MSRFPKFPKFLLLGTALHPFIPQPGSRKERSGSSSSGRIFPCVPLHPCSLGMLKSLFFFAKEEFSSRAARRTKHSGVEGGRDPLENSRRSSPRVPLPSNLLHPPHPKIHGIGCGRLGVSWEPLPQSQLLIPFPEILHPSHSMGSMGPIKHLKLENSKDPNPPEDSDRGGKSTETRH